MKRSLIAAIAACFLTVVMAPAFADDVDFKTPEGIKKFWQQQEDQRGGGEGGSGGGGGQ